MWRSLPFSKTNRLREALAASGEPQAKGLNTPSSSLHSRRLHSLISPPVSRSDRTSSGSGSDASKPQTRTGIGLLPVDLFVSILELSISWGSDSRFPPSHDIHGLFRINAVCRHWRWISLNSPFFWTYIPSDLHPNLIGLLLERSANSPLHVHLVCQQDGNLELQDLLAGAVEVTRDSDKRLLSNIALLIPHFHRLRFLSLRVETLALSQINKELDNFRHDTPKLEGLHIHVTRNLWGGEDERFIAETALLFLAKIRSPLLREVHFEGVDIPSDSVPIKSLSRLSLTLITYANTAKTDWRTLLGSGNSLVSLSMQIWSAVDLVDGGATPNTISLPNLRQLVLKGTCEQCLLVYRTLSAPSLEEMRWETGTSDLIHAALAIPRSPPGDHLLVNIDHDTIRLEFMESKRSSLRTNTRFVSTFVSQCQTVLRTTGIVRLLILLKSRRFSEVNVVEFSTSAHYDPLFMSTFLSYFPNLQSLRIHARTDTPFPIEDAINLGVLRSGPSCCRSLRNLAFGKFVVIMPQASPFFIALSAINGERRNTGLPPLILEFWNCDGITDALLRACGLKTSS